MAFCTWRQWLPGGRDRPQGLDDAGTREEEEEARVGSRTTPISRRKTGLSFFVSCEVVKDHKEAFPGAASMTAVSSLSSHVGRAAQRCTWLSSKWTRQHLPNEAPRQFWALSPNNSTTVIAAVTPASLFRCDVTAVSWVWHESVCSLKMNEWC